MVNRNQRVCPVEHAGFLDNRFRRWFQDPRKILAPYLRKGMQVLDIGCGPGFFAIEMAHLVGPSGRVIAADLQAGMLGKLRDKIAGTALEDRITLHKSGHEAIGVTDPVDFALAFYMVHEVPNRQRFFEEVGSHLNENGRLLVVEPAFHVSRKAFGISIREAEAVGFTPFDGPRVCFSRAVLLSHG